MRVLTVSRSLRYLRVPQGIRRHGRKADNFIYRSLRLVLLSSSVFEEELFFFLPSARFVADDGETLLGEDGLDPES